MLVMLGILQIPMRKQWVNKNVKTLHLIQFYAIIVLYNKNIINKKEKS